MSKDTIDRQAAIDAYGDWYVEEGTDYGFIGTVKQLLEGLPPAEPQRIRAKWIATTALQEGQITWRDYKCSNCSHHRGKPMNYCEVCGAKMER